MVGLKFGAKVEEEHKGTYKYIQKTFKETGKIPSSRQIYQSIAKDHLKENPNYYSKIKRCNL